MQPDELDQLLDQVSTIDLRSPECSRELQQLVNLLWTCEYMKSRNKRKLVVAALPQDIQRAINRDDYNDLTDIEFILRTCLDYPDGLKRLIESVTSREGESKSVQKIYYFLQSLDILYKGSQIRKLTLFIADMQLKNTDLADLYRACAPSSPDDYWQYPRRLDDSVQAIAWVLDHLNNAPVPQQGRGLPSLLTFVERLAAYTKDKGSQAQLRTWIDQEAVPAWQVDMRAIIALRKQLAEDTGPPAQPAEPFSPSLMIQLEPLDKQNLNQFTVKAWLKYGQEETACQSLEVPLDKICDATSILELLDPWLDELDANGTIEFFLPRSLFNLKVDEWKMPSEQGKTLGVLYQVVLRSSERFVSPFLRAKGTWKENWRRIKNLQPEEDVIKWLSDIQEYDGESLYDKLLEEKKFVLWLLVSPFTIDPDDKCLVLHYMLRAGTPIALWLKEPANGQEGETLKTLLSKNSLSDWPRLILEQRQKAAALLREAMLHSEDVGKIQQHPGRCFTLFWDDPTRMPLEYTQKFQETGIRR